MKLNMDKNSQVNLISGLISENRSSGFGGGIDYTNHETNASSYECSDNRKSGIAWCRNLGVPDL